MHCSSSVLSSFQNHYVRPMPAAAPAACRSQSRDGRSRATLLRLRAAQLGSMAAPATTTTTSSSIQQGDQAKVQQQQQQSAGWFGGLFNKRRGDNKQQQQDEQDTPFLPTITAAQLESMLQERAARSASSTPPPPLIVIFSARWCGPCKVMVQRLSNMLASPASSGLAGTGAQAFKLDTDECPELATELKVHKLPTMFFIGTAEQQDKPAAAITGLLPEAVLTDMVCEKSKFLGSDMRRAVSW